MNDYRNASSLPPRLPILSNILRDLHHPSNNTNHARVKYTLVALSYRGYWTSHGRPSQKGIELDALAALDWIRDTYSDSPTIVLWGQSIGAGVATSLAAHHAELPDRQPGKVPIGGLILETPFLSIPSMLVTLYPQRWLPYRYLTPFLRNWWDSEAALRRVGVALAQNTTTKDADRAKESRKRMPVLIVSAANDELVPVQQADRLQEVCVEAGLDVQRQRVAGALHTDATVRGEGRSAVVRFLRGLTS